MMDSALDISGGDPSLWIYCIEGTSGYLQQARFAGKAATTYAALYTTSSSPPASSACTLETTSSATLSSTTPTISATIITPQTSFYTTTPRTTDDTVYPATSHTTSNDLSTGAIAGIAVGAIVGALAFLDLTYMVWRNGRELKKLKSIGQITFGHAKPPPVAELASPQQYSTCTSPLSPYQDPRELPQAGNPDFGRNSGR
ncbi:hypothetical protein EK21DRAFT_85624 [Setomelanomma holmii]|uniref:Uncharacterized protein n=1 Tax=Setomelanomma holmii TaxID=210430 RepID=A0A9P4HFU3_9PLEO|nr:hypothetical protein EK21DRAFT_85624 [Setomelanomma holmii]